MFHLNSKPDLIEGLASNSSHVTSGWLTPRLQSVRPYYYGSSLLNQEASNAFPPFHYWKPCPIERFNPTAILNFYRYLLKECHTYFSGVRAVFTNIDYALKQFIVYEHVCRDVNSVITNAKCKFLSTTKVGSFLYSLNPIL